MENILDFLSFLKKYFPEYEIDGHNLPVIKNLTLWALRDATFNDKGRSWHIDKGICLFGNTGTGKTRLFWLLNKYLNYIKSPYCFAGRVVWEYASEFEKDGYVCFEGIHKTLRNIYFDELALIEDSDMPQRELIGHYANKALIGRELIMQVYNKFIETAYQAHFSTNTKPDDLGRIYGDRAFSRLHEMCNFIPLLGLDRRKSENWAPPFKKNLNQPTQPRAAETEYNADEDNIRILEQHYLDFLADKQPSAPLALVYNTLVAYNVKVATDDELRALMEEIEGFYTPEVILSRRSKSEMESEKKTAIWERSRQIAVQLFFQKLKDQGCKSIFGVREVGEIDINLKKI